jgi:hypothetical protein
MLHKPATGAGFRYICWEGLGLTAEIEREENRKHYRCTPNIGVITVDKSAGSAKSQLIPGARTGGHSALRRRRALGQKQTAKASQVVENPPAGGDVEMQFGQVVRDQEKRFLAPLRPVAFGHHYFRFDVAPGFIKGFGKHRHVLVGAFDTVKRRFWTITHKHAFPTSPPGRLALC